MTQQKHTGGGERRPDERFSFSYWSFWDCQNLSDEVDMLIQVCDEERILPYFWLKEACRLEDAS
jgi:hypothetical protein